MCYLEYMEKKTHDVFNITNISIFSFIYTGHMEMNLESHVKI